MSLYPFVAHRIPLRLALGRERPQPAPACRDEQHPALDTAPPLWSIFYARTYHWDAVQVVILPHDDNEIRLNSSSRRLLFPVTRISTCQRKRCPSPLQHAPRAHRAAWLPATKRLYPGSEFLLVVRTQRLGYSLVAPGVRREEGGKSTRPLRVVRVLICFFLPWIPHAVGLGVSQHTMSQVTGHPRVFHTRF